MKNKNKERKKKVHARAYPKYLIHGDGGREATDARIFVNLFFPSIWRADYARNAFEIAFTPSPVTFDRKPLCVAVRFAVGPGKSRPRFRGTPANRVVVYREISTLTSFRRPRNSFRRSPSAVHWREARRNLAYRGKNHFLFFSLSFLPPSLSHRLLPFLSPHIPNHLPCSRAHRSGTMIALSSPTTGEFGLAPVKRYSRAAHATSNSLSFVPVLTDFGYCSTTRVALSFRERVAERERERCRAFAVLPVFSLLSISPSNPFIIFLLILRDRILSSFPFSIKKRSIIVRVTENVPSEIRFRRSIRYRSFRSNLMINSLRNSLIVRTVSITLATSGVYLVPEKRIRRRSHSPILVDPIDRVSSFPEGGRKGWIDNRSYILFLEYITSLSKLCRGCEQRGRGGRAGTFGTYKARFRSRAPWPWYA